MLGQLAGDPDALASYDPFHLICATPDSVTALTWLGGYLPGGRPPVPPDVRGGGMTPVVRELAPGTHLFTNAGHAFPVEPGDPADDPKAAHFADKFAAARPSADPALPLAQAWGDWLTLTAGDGLDPADPAAIIVRRDLPGGQVYGTTSVTLVALADASVRYDFQPHPGNRDGWYSVSIG